MIPFQQLITKLFALKYPRIQAIQLEKTLSFYEFTLLVNFLENAYIRILDESDRRSLAPISETGDITQYINTLRSYLTSSELNIPSIIVNLSMLITTDISGVAQNCPMTSEKARFRLAMFLCNKAIEFEFIDNIGVSDITAVCNKLHTTNVPFHIEKTIFMTDDSANNSDAQVLENTPNNSINIVDITASTLLTPSASDLCYPLHQFQTPSEYLTPMSTLYKQFPLLHPSMVSVNALQQLISTLSQLSQQSNTKEVSYMIEYQSILSTIINQGISASESTHAIIIQQLRNIIPYTFVPAQITSHDSPQNINIFQITPEIEQNMTLAQFLLYIVTIYKFTIEITQGSSMYFSLPYELFHFSQNVLYAQNGSNYAPQILYIQARAVYTMTYTIIKEFIRFIQHEFSTALLSTQHLSLAINSDNFQSTTNDAYNATNVIFNESLKPTTPGAYFDKKRSSVELMNDTNISLNDSPTSPISATATVQRLQKPLCSESFAHRNPTISNNLKNKTLYTNLVSIATLSAQDALFTLKDIERIPSNDNRMTKIDLVENHLDFLSTPQTFVRIISSVARMLYDQQLLQQQTVINQWIEHLQTFSMVSRQQ